MNSTGNPVGDDLDLHRPYINAVKPIGVPWYNVIGNHDGNYDVDTDTLTDETFEKNFGPANYSNVCFRLNMIIQSSTFVLHDNSNRRYEFLAKILINSQRMLYGRSEEDIIYIA